MGELMRMREQYMRKRSKGCVCSFSVADRLPLSMIYFVVHEAEKKRDEFWQMMCVEMVGDVVGMRLPVVRLAWRSCSVGKRNLTRCFRLRHTWNA